MPVKLEYSSCISSMKAVSILLLFFVALTLPFCRKASEEEYILGFMEDMAKYTENKDLESIMGNLSDDYRDFENRDKGMARRMIDDYFQQYKGIVVHILSTRINEMNPSFAHLESEIAFSSGAGKVFRKLVRFSTDNYRLKIRLARISGKWKATYAEWRYVTINELYPESLSVLKKILPGAWE